MRFKLNIENLKKIYTVANTAAFLIDRFKLDESIRELAIGIDSKDLIDEFNIIASKTIETLDEIVYAYAIFIAILLKRNRMTDDFLDGSGNINFEWFPEIKDIYLARYKPTVIDFIKVNSQVNPTPQITKSSESTLQIADW